MLDILIRGGRIVDGSGQPAFEGDVGIRDGKIVEVGKVTMPARETIDAAGALVTPGFIDPHTHYDGQFTWDDRIEPSFFHGVTTVIGGNCGVGFAPVRADHHEALIDMMDGVEDIPGIVLSEGLQWNWESFTDYMDVLEKRCFTMDVGVQMTHAPLRVYVMGKRALDHEPATAEDIAQMAELVREAMAAGALGLSVARLVEHKARSGANVPGTFADGSELLALARAMGEFGRGVFQIVPLGAAGGYSKEERDAEHDRFIDLARAAGRPLTYLLQQTRNDPEDWRRLVRESEGAVAEGVDIRPQIAIRGFGLLVMSDGLHPFARRPTYLAHEYLPLAERLAELRKPEVRAAILGEANDPSIALRQGEGVMLDNLAELYPLDEAMDYEPETSRQFGAQAEATGVSLEALIYDHLFAGLSGGTAMFFALNYSNGNLDHVAEMLRSPVTIAGLGDGGAHTRMICDASLPTFGLTFWARDRVRGQRIALEEIVRRQTSEPAALYDLHDRGLIEPGRRADINVIDFERLQLCLPEMRHDLPAGGARVIQEARGYIATLVNGVVTRRHDKDTGARPGRLIRGIGGKATSEPKEQLLVD